jgi:hypothetical protein
MLPSAHFGLAAEIRAAANGAKCACNFERGQSRGF